MDKDEILAFIGVHDDCVCKTCAFQGNKEFEEKYRWQKSVCEKYTYVKPRDVYFYGKPCKHWQKKA